MKTNEVIETIGNITKMEHLKSLDSDILENSLVLKNIDPFPGFRNQNLSLENKPGSIFIILRYRYAPEKINRINKTLQSESYADLRISFGEITTKSEALPCIRIKGLQNYGVIPDIQEYYKRQDLKLMGYRPFDMKARIKIYKTFKLMEIADGLYRDMHESVKLYVHIPKPLNWKRFDTITTKVKFDLKNKNFDAALGLIYRYSGPEDVVRIYDEDISLGRALELKRHYLKEVKQEIHLGAAYKH